DVAGPIRQMQLYTRNSIYLADLYNVNNMTKILTKVNTKLDDFLTYDTASGSTGTSTVKGTQSILRRNNLPNISVIETADLKDNGGGVYTLTTTSSVEPMRTDGLVCSLSLTEPLYVE